MEKHLQLTCQGARRVVVGVGGGIQISHSSSASQNRSLQNGFLQSLLLHWTARRVREELECQAERRVRTGYLSISEEDGFMSAAYTAISRRHAITQLCHMLHARWIRPLPHSRREPDVVVNWSNRSIDFTPADLQWGLLRSHLPVPTYEIPQRY